MSEVVTKYRGHNIRWSDNSEEWVCFDLSDKLRSSPKLSAIKAAIDRLYLAERKAGAVPCFEICSDRRTEGMVVEYLQERRERRWHAEEDTVPHQVAVVAKRHGSTKPSRAETQLDRLMPVNAEAEAAWQNYLKLKEVAENANKIASEALRAVPRMKPEDIAALIALRERGDEVQP